MCSPLCSNSVRMPGCLHAGEPANDRADRHAHTRDISLAQDVARHDFTGGVDVAARLTTRHDDARAIVYLQPQIREGDARPEWIAPERWSVDPLCPVRLFGHEALRVAVVQDRVVERPGTHGS